jgi:transcriptional regulator GlxA family with amidase domain
MKKIKRILLSVLTTVMILGLICYAALSKVFAQDLKTFKCDTNFTWALPKQDSNKKNVFIIANNDGTELFDFFAPFYLFNNTEKCNVYVVAERKAPVLLVNSLFLLPHYSFTEIDSLHIAPDVLVLPNVTVRLKTPPRESIVNWVKNHVFESTILLSICDGSATAAATGLYDGKALTTHATDFKKLQKMYPKPFWKNNVSVTQSGNLYSTAGVSNAVEGSLTVIKRLFGEETSNAVLHSIHYPHNDIKVDHESAVVNNGAITKIVKKVVLKKKVRMGVLLSEGINEFELASLLDTYVRSFPSALNTFSLNETKVVSKYGLTLYPTGDTKGDKITELHVLDPGQFQNRSETVFTNAKVVSYQQSSNQYPIDICLDRIGQLYGDKFQNCVKLMLDYN